jgi:hypothetical protein
VILNVCSNVSLSPTSANILLPKQNLIPGKQKYFLPNSETFGEIETLFLHLLTLVRQFDILKTLTRQII